MVKVICENCGKEFEIENKYYNRSKTKKFFCSKKCSCIFNNSSKSIIANTNDDIFIDAVNTSKSVREICRKIGYKSISSFVVEEIKKKCESLNIKYPNSKHVKGKRSIREKTKGEILSSFKTYQGYRSAIRRDAEKTFEELDGHCSCCVCGYNRHIEIAHVKAVSSFSHNALIKEINNIENIIPLCPNHHWEFDNGVMNEDNLLKIEKYLKNRKNSGMEE